MPTIQINATGLDGTGNTVFFFNNFMFVQPTNWPGVRFPNVAVPQGTNVVSAILRLVSFPSVLGGETGSAWGRWYGDKVANAAAWGNSSRPDQISKTTAFTAAQSNPSDGVTLNHNVTAIVQELVNQGSWVSGNAMRFACDPATANGLTAYYDYSDSAANAATLIIVLAHSMAAGSGSFTLTGAAAALVRGKNLPAASGSFTLTGNSVGLFRALKLAAGSGTFVLTGADSALRHGKNLFADAGVFVLTGSDINLSPFYKSFSFAGSKGRGVSFVSSRAFSSRSRRSFSASARNR